MLQTTFKSYGLQADNLPIVTVVPDSVKKNSLLLVNISTVLV